MVMILRVIKSNFDHIRYQILTNQEIPTMESLTTWRFVPALKVTNLQESTESLAMVSPHGKGNHRIRGGQGGKGHP